MSGMIQRSVLKMAAASWDGQSDGPPWVMQMAALGLTISTVHAAGLDLYMGQAGNATTRRRTLISFWFLG